MRCLKLLPVVSLLLLSIGCSAASSDDADSSQDAIRGAPSDNVARGDDPNRPWRQSELDTIPETYAAARAEELQSHGDVEAFIASHPRRDPTMLARMRQLARGTKSAQVFAWFRRIDDKARWLWILEVEATERGARTLYFFDYSRLAIPVDSEIGHCDAKDATSALTGCSVD